MHFQLIAQRQTSQCAEKMWEYEGSSSPMPREILEVIHIKSLAGRQLQCGAVRRLSMVELKITFSVSDISARSF